MVEKTDGLQVEIDKLEAEEKEIEYNSPLARIRRKKEELKRQQREKEKRHIEKELKAVQKKTQKASKVVDKISAKRQEVAMSGAKWERDKMTAVADVQRLVAQEMRLRNKLKELETAGASQEKELGWVEIMRAGGKTSDKFEVFEEK